jgi:hypothetical protein
MSMVRYKQGEIPPITEEHRAELKALAERPDSEIDYSEIPPLTDEFWKKRCEIRSTVLLKFTPPCVSTPTLWRG